MRDVTEARAVTSAFDPPDLRDAEEALDPRRALLEPPLLALALSALYRRVTVCS